MKTILIAEDNELNFGLFLRILNDIGIEILHARNGMEAIEICNSTPNISLILMDINMPVMNGEDAALLIKAQHPDIPIISQTAYDITGMVSKENRWCFVDFISKPIDVPNLKHLIKKYCFIEK